MCTALGATIRTEREGPTTETCVCSLMSPPEGKDKGKVVAVTTVCVVSGTRGARLRCGWTTLASSTTRLVLRREGSPTESKKRVISLWNEMAVLPCHRLLDKQENLPRQAIKGQRGFGL